MENRQIYADHAATTPLAPQVLAAMEPYLKENYANPAALYRAGLRCRQAVERARQEMAALLGCAPGELYFTSGGSEGNSWAVWNGALRPGGPLVTTPIEHHSILRACEGMKKLGVSTRLVPVDPAGRIHKEALKELLAQRPRLVSLQYANNETGVIQDMEGLAALCREAGALLHTDAVQAVGHIPVRAGETDLLTGSAHKFSGPKGVGFLYVRRGTPLIPLIYGGDQEGGLRGGTTQTAAVVGMAAALRLSLEQMEGQKKALRAMAEEFCETLRRGLPNVRFHSGSSGLPGLVSVLLPGCSAQRMVYRMDLKGVAVSPGAACDNGGVKRPSHVLTALGDSREEALSTLRVSFGPANRPEDGRETALRLVQAYQEDTYESC